MPAPRSPSHSTVFKTRIQHTGLNRAPSIWIAVGAARRGANNPQRWRSRQKKCASSAVEFRSPRRSLTAPFGGSFSDASPDFRKRDLAARVGTIEPARLSREPHPPRGAIGLRNAGSTVRDGDRRKAAVLARGAVDGPSLVWFVRRACCNG